MNSRENHEPMSFRLGTGDEKMFRRISYGASDLGQNLSLDLSCCQHFWAMSRALIPRRSQTQMELLRHLRELGSKDRYGGFLVTRGTPSHHPFLDGIFNYQPSFFGYPICCKPPYGKPIQVNVVSLGGSSLSTGIVEASTKKRAAGTRRPKSFPTTDMSG